MVQLAMHAKSSTLYGWSYIGWLYIPIFLAWWDTTILYNYGAMLCELRYELYDVSLENLVLDQLIIPYLTFSLILIKSLLDISMTLWGEILS